MSIVYSIDCKLFRGTAGSTATTEVREINRVKMRATVTPADATTRTTSGWANPVATKKSVQVTFTMVCACTDTDFIAFRTAFFATTPVALQIADNTGNGVNADFLFTQMEINQDIAAAGRVTATFTAVSTPIQRNPEWQTPPAG